MADFNQNENDLPTTDKDGAAITDDNPLTLADLLVRIIERTDPVLGIPGSGILTDAPVSPINWSLLGLYLRDIFLQQQIDNINIDSATTEQEGIAEIATLLEALNGIDNTRIMTSALVLAFLRDGQNVEATETRKGTIQLATQGEVNTGEEEKKAVTPATLAQRLNNILSGYETSTVAQQRINASLGSLSIPLWKVIPSQTAVLNQDFFLDLWLYLTGRAPITITSTALPTGLTLNDNGTISGQATGGTGSRTVTLTGVNARGTRTQTFTLITSNG